ncbi:hypothetical protein LTR56_019730 [Elasticomyces elasticus]|nr:hypothetical protein LTR56_019730 [Elasticomyces elasticus]KAK3655798.1 hypothetical protein LTR22_010092 [Elasticomyces elasticus]KAK4925862.1 hypothetical protein LTR49_007239 [Elasticomyces elasticus]KAK5764817.1 hypothetical protein LTS12_005087 [Elasticomyces elasticus]
MVQYRNTEWTLSPISQAQDWWKLDDRQDVYRNDARAILYKRGFSHNKSSTVVRFKALLRRSDRGLCSYDKRSKAELLQFCESRGYARSDVLKSSKADLIALLENYEPVFEPFMELPPELRVLIYEYHLASLESLSPVVTPPITAVSKIVRKEALPCFYDTHRFVFDEEPFEYGEYKKTYINNIPTSNFSQMRKLRLTAYDKDIQCDIDLGGKTAQARIEKLVWINGIAEVMKEVVGAMSERVTGVLKALDMDGRPEGKAFQLDDLALLMEAVMGGTNW